MLPGTWDLGSGTSTAFRSIVSKNVASSEDGLEWPGRPEERPPWLQVCPLTPTWVKFQRLDCHSWTLLPSPMLLSSMLVGEGDSSCQLLCSSKSCY